MDENGATQPGRAAILKSKHQNSILLVSLSKMASKAWTKLDCAKACVDPTQVAAQSDHSDLAQESIAQKQLFRTNGKKTV